MTPLQSSPTGVQLTLLQKNIYIHCHKWDPDPHTALLSMKKKIRRLTIMDPDHLIQHHEADS